MGTVGGETIVLRDGRRLGFAEWGDPDGRPLVYFHGHPSSRAEGRWYDKAASAAGVRVIAPDRPGMGLSDFQPRRSLLDWPDDVSQLADVMALRRFSVLGASGGSPYAAVCALRIPQRAVSAGIASGIAPLDVPGMTNGMSRLNRVLYRDIGRIPALPRLLMGVAAVLAKRASAVVDRGRRAIAAVDRPYLDRPDVREVLEVTFPIPGRICSRAEGTWPSSIGFRRSCAPCAGDFCVALVQDATAKSTSFVSTVPAVRPGAVWKVQYRFVCAMT